MSTKEIPVKKNEENELPIPSAWRPTFTEIVTAMVRKDYLLMNGISGVSKVSINTASQIKEYIDDYGEELVQLPSETWNTSVYLWYGKHWEVLVDLWTIGEGRSDLVLKAEVHEKNGGYMVDIKLVYVP